ncbi:alkaline phosphatase D family protein, partial [Streptomyces flaveolus]|uniref:alkaline phosphatase D family protein n=1 Tax=Streptomyces flaveolus TaxID=67297 RepID=UPI00341B931C
MSLAFASCQAIWEGWFTAHRELAARRHDVVLFLGDYIYEFGNDRGVRPGDDVLRTRQAVTLDEYRQRYASRGIRNVVSLAGDLHRTVVSDLALDFTDPDSKVVATEFVGTSLTSAQDGEDLDAAGRVLLEENPHMRFGNFQRGYVSCEITPDLWVSEFPGVRPGHGARRHREHPHQARRRERRRRRPAGLRGTTMKKTLTAVAAAGVVTVGFCLAAPVDTAVAAPGGKARSEVVMWASPA